MPAKDKILLTEHAHGAGCGCKIAPQVLTQILNGERSSVHDKKLLVGNHSNDDAAVYDLGNGTALIASTDFFMPIVDDAFEFGRIASANAISDIYAMGGTPTLALAILGWPVNKLPADLARQVIQGARAVCEEAGIPLAGGHSIDTLEPMFGLSVNGLVNLEHLKRNDTAKEGDFIFLTKPLGTGILSTAQKRKLITEEDKKNLLEQLGKLNTIGQTLGQMKGVTAMTDVTGFGLLGHLSEMAQGANLSAELHYNKIPKMKNLGHYIKQAVVPDATYRNWNAYSAETELAEGVDAAEAFMVLPDPQTNGGILFTCSELTYPEIKSLLHDTGFEFSAEPIGKMLAQNGKRIKVLQ